MTDRLSRRAAVGVAGFAIVFAALLLGMWGIDANTRALADATRKVRDAAEASRALERVLLSLVDAESGQRGFVLSGDGAFLEPFEAAAARLPGELDRLSDLSSSDDRAARVGEMRREADSLLAEWRRVIALRRKNPAAALEIAGANRPRMEAVRAAIDEMRGGDLETTEALARSAESARVANRVGAVMSGSGGLLLLVLLLALMRSNAKFESRAREQVAAERERLRVTLDGIGDGLISCDAAGLVVGMNPVAERLVGLTAAAAIGRPLTEVFVIVNEDTRAAVDNPALRAVREGRVVGLANHTLLVSADGTERPIDDSAAPIRDASGRTVGAALVFRDVTERRAAEEALRESEHRLRFLFENLNDYAVIGLDPTGEVRDWSAGAEAIFGWKKEDIAGRHFRVIFTEADRAAGVPEHELKEAAGAGRGEDKRWHLRRDGSRFFAEGVVTAVRGEGGKLRGYTKIAADVTDRVEREHLVAESRRFLQSALDALSAHIAIIDDSGFILSVNESWRRFAVANGFVGAGFGVGQNYLEACEAVGGACDPESADVVVGIRAVMSGEREAYLHEYPCHSPSEQRWFQLRVTRFSGAGPRRIVVAHENITPRVLSEQNTLRQSLRLRRLTGSAAQVSAVNDVKSVLGVAVAEARALIPSRQAATLVHGGPADAVFRAESFADVSLNAYAPPRDNADLYAFVNRLNLPVRLTDAELRGHPGWREFASRVTGRPPMRGLLAAPILGRDGRPMGLIELSDRIDGDFTEDDANVLVQLANIAAVAIENARLVEQLFEADRRKDEFLAMLAHELRNPLAPISNSSRILAATDDPAAATEAVAVIERQLRQMVRLVDDLLDVSRVSRGKIALQVEPTDAAEVVRAAVETARSLIDAAGHELTVSLPDGPLPLDVDRARTVQVLGNLLTNAAKYTDRGGKVAVEVTREGDLVTFAVRDNGVGIPAEMLSRVFEMFAQVDTSLERSQGGLGIGLTLVKRLVEMQGGTVAAASAGRGRGSEFVVRLPLGRTVATVRDTATGAPAAGASLRVLVADDNADSCASLAALLEIVGHTVRTAADGAEALEIAEAFRPDAVVTDIGMPRVNGYEVARRIRATPWGAAVTVIALTGWSQQRDRDTSAGAGFDHHLVKPVDFDMLCRLLAGVRRR